MSSDFPSQVGLTGLWGAGGRWIPGIKNLLTRLICGGSTADRRLLFPSQVLFRFFVPGPHEAEQVSSDHSLHSPSLGLGSKYNDSSDLKI